MSNMIAEQNQVEFEQAANQRLGSFTKQHRRVLGRDFVPRIAGLLICYNIPAADLNGTGRTFVAIKGLLHSVLQHPQNENSSEIFIVKRCRIIVDDSQTIECHLVREMPYI